MHTRADRSLAYTLNLIVSFMCWSCDDEALHKNHAIDQGIIYDVAITLVDTGGIDSELDVDLGVSDTEGDRNYPNTADSICEDYSRDVQAFPLSEHRIPEASGLAFSAVSPRSLWSHNDSGDDTKVIALSDQGEIFGELRINDESQDLEDIDIAPCPHQNRACLWLADVGDNEQIRERLNIYIIPEPPTGLPFDPIDQQLISQGGEVLKISFTLENGPADIEALVVHHQGHKLWLFEKVQGFMSRIWQLQWSRSELDSLLHQEDIYLRATIQSEFQAPGIPVEHGQKITGADLSPRGKYLVLRVYTGVYEYALSSPYALDSLTNAEPRLIRLGPLSEPKGEAITYGWQGQGLWTISESQEAIQDLHYLACDND